MLIDFGELVGGFGVRSLDWNDFTDEGFVVVNVVLVLRRCDSSDMYSRRDSGASNERGVKGTA